MRRIERPDDRAEGDIVIAGQRYPYNTELASINGVWLHVWLAKQTPTPELLQSLEQVARRNRDVVRLTYSDGDPTSYWAHQEMTMST